MVFSSSFSLLGSSLRSRSIFPARTFSSRSNKGVFESDKLLRLYEIAKEKNIPLTLVATKHLIRLFGRMGMVDQSVLVYERLDANMKDTQVRNVLIDVLFKNRLVDDALKVLDEMLQKDSVSPPNRITADIVFHEVWSGRRHTEEEIATLILKFSSHGLFPNTVWLTRFLSSMCRRTCRTDEAWKILGELMKNKAPLEAPPFNALLTCLARNREIGEMNAIVVKMDEMGIRADAVTLGIRINSLCKSRRVDEAMEVFRKMCGKKTDCGNEIKADVIHYNTLIDGLCKVGRMKDAEDLLVKMKKEGTCAPDDITYKCLIDGYCRAGQPETAKEVVSRMEEDGCLTAEQLETAKQASVELLKKMRHQDFSPDHIEFLALLKYCSDAGLIDEGRWEDLEKVRASMKESRLKEERPGCSWLEIDGKVHIFTAGKVSGEEEVSHPEIQAIEEKLREITSYLKR